MKRHRPPFQEVGEPLGDGNLSVLDDVGRVDSRADGRIEVKVHERPQLVPVANEQLSNRVLIPVGDEVQQSDSLHGVRAGRRRLHLSTYPQTRVKSDRQTDPTTIVMSNRIASVDSVEGLVLVIPYEFAMEETPPGPGHTSWCTPAGPAPSAPHPHLL